LLNYNRKDKVNVSLRAQLESNFISVIKGRV